MADGGKRIADSGLLLVLACLAACLATPYHYRGLAWPTPLGLTHTEQALRHDPLGRTLVLSPFGPRFATSPAFRSPGAWAYYVLLAAGGTSFVLTVRCLHPGRLLTWSALAALSIYQARAIPFFAVAAAPVLALNVQDWWRGRAPSARLHRLRIAVGGTGVLVGIALLVLAWPGWLQPAPYQPRGWAVEPDGSLVRLAARLGRWHAEGRLAPDRVALTFSPEVAHYLAWACPAEKGFVDSRWPLFDRVADDYVRMRRSLLDEDAGPELVALLDAHRIDRVLLHDTDWDRMSRAYRGLSLAESEWELLAVEGGATVFVRRGSTSPPPDAFDPRRAAYHPARDERAPPAPRPPRAPQWLDAFRPRPDDRSPDREEAALHLLSFDLQTGRRHTDVLRRWVVAQAAGLIACGRGEEPAGGAAALALRLHLTPLPPPDSGAEGPGAAEEFAAAFLALDDVGPPEPLLLAVRAARRALAVNPDDAVAFLLLGEAYFRLARQTREPGWRTILPDLAPLRQAQMLTALEEAAALRPDLDRAHELLAQLYYEQGQLDRSLDHLRQRLRIAEQTGRRRGPGAKEADGRRAALRADVEKMEKMVSQSEKTYRANLAGKTDPSKVLERAQLAARFGLSRKALEMLLESSSVIFGRRGAEYELDLMAQSGQCYEIRTGLDPKLEGQIDFNLYHSVKARTAAACGDYKETDAELGRGGEPLRRIGRPPNLLLPVRSAVAFHVTEAVLTRSRGGEGAAGLAAATAAQFETFRPLGMPVELLRGGADRDVLRGLLALEAGEAEEARQHFRAAREVWGGEGAAASGAGLDFPARPVAALMLRRLQE